LGDDPRGLGAALDPEDVERAANPLVDGVRGDVELDRDLFGIEVLVDQQQALELPRAEALDPQTDIVSTHRVTGSHYGCQSLTPPTQTGNHTGARIFSIYVKSEKTANFLQRDALNAIRSRYRARKVSSNQVRSDIANSLV